MDITGYILISFLLNTGGIFYDEHKVDTFPEWCEQISGVNLEEKYGGGLFFKVSFDAEKIRNDITKFLNTAYLKKVEGRAKEMVKREGTTLYIINLSNLFIMKPEELINEYREKVQGYWNGKYDKAGKCLFGTIATMFDKIVIVSWIKAPNTTYRQKKETVIDTLRIKNLGDKRL